VDNCRSFFLVFLSIPRNPQGSMVDLKTHLRKARRARWANKTKKEKQAAASKASHAYWDALSPKQRSAEMKRRAAKRKKRASRKRGETPAK
jgi:hypothetical protein